MGKSNPIGPDLPIFFGGGYVHVPRPLEDDIKHIVVHSRQSRERRDDDALTAASSPYYIPKAKFQSSNGTSGRLQQRRQAAAAAAATQKCQAEIG